MDDAGAFIEHVPRGDLEVRQAGDLWKVDLLFVFRLEDGGRVLNSPVRRGAPEPVLIIEEWLDPTGRTIVTYNYDVTVNEFGQHFGFHLHEHETGKGIAPHRQGYGVPGGHEDWKIVDIFRDRILNQLVRKAIWRSMLSAPPGCGRSARGDFDSRTSSTPTRRSRLRKASDPIGRPGLPPGRSHGLGREERARIA